MNYDEKHCHPAAPGPPSKQYPPQARMPYIEPQPIQPQVVIQVAPSNYQFWPTAHPRQPPPIPQQRYVPSQHQQASLLPQQFQQNPQRYRQQYHQQYAPQHPEQNAYQRQPNYTQPYAYPQQPATQQQAYDLNNRVSAQPQWSTSKSIAPGPQTSTPTTSKTAQRPIRTPDLPVDYRLLLLSLSDQYIAQAHSMAALLTHNRSSADTQMYYKLMSAGMGCLQAVLHKFSQSMAPRQLASLQLRYATLLYDETDNDGEVEAILTKGITFCEMNRLLDLKYTMQHLLARVLFKSNAKASFKYLELAIRDAATCQHTAWIYAFRFLRVSLLLQRSAHHESVLVLQDLEAIQELAKRRGDSALVVVAAVVEALVRVQSSDADAVREAQRAIATARAEQLNDIANALPQLTALTHFADVACSLSPYDVVSVTKKMKHMQEYLDQISEIKTWSRDGTFAVPLTRTVQPGLTDNTGGIFLKDAGGRDSVTFSWLGRPDVYLIGFILSGEATYSRNARGGVAEKFILEGLKMAEDQYQVPEVPINLPLTRASSRVRFRLSLKGYLLLRQTLCHCERSAWSAMQTSLQTFQDILRRPDLQPSEDLLRFSAYLTAVVNHAVGNLNTALHGYRDPLLLLPENPKSLTSSAHETLAVLTTLNILSIIHATEHPEHGQASALLSRLEHYFPSYNNVNGISPTSPIFQSRNNPHLAAAHHLHLALQSSTLIASKKHLKHALDISNKASSSQIRAFVLTYLASAFFAGQTGEDARSHVLGARRGAQEAGSKLLTAAADGLLKDLFEREGRPEEARKMEIEGQNLVTGLGEGLKAFLYSQAVAGPNGVANSGS